METISPAPHPLIHDDDDDDDDDDDGGWCPYYGRLLYEIDLFSVVNKKYDDDDDDVVMCLCYPLDLLFLICCILTHSAWGALRFKDFSAPHPLIHDDGWCPYYGRLLYEIDLFSIVNEEVWWWWCCYVLVLCTWSSIFNMLHINSLCMRCVTFQGFFCPHPLIHDDDGWCPYYDRLLYEIDLFSVVNKKYDEDDVVMCLCYALDLLFLICCILVHSAWGANRAIHFKDFLFFSGKGIGNKISLYCTLFSLYDPIFKTSLFFTRWRPRHLLPF